METVMRSEFTISSGVLYHHLLQHFEIAPRCIEFGKPDLVDRLDETRGAAIHDRNFRAVDLDQSVVNAEAAQRGKEMLNRRNRGAIAIAKNGAESDAGHRPLIGRDLGAFGVAIAEKEANACIAISWTKCDGDWRSAVDPGAGK